jgi:hypothetical protein
MIHKMYDFLRQYVDAHSSEEIRDCSTFLPEIFLQPNNPPKSQSPIKKSKQGIYFAFTLTQQQNFS